MNRTLVGLRLLFLLASVLFAGLSLQPVGSRAAGQGKVLSSKCPTFCGTQGPIWCGGICRRPE